jgi:hypothetical protein
MTQLVANAFDSLVTNPFSHLFALIPKTNVQRKAWSDSRFKNAQEESKSTSLTVKLFGSQSLKFLKYGTRHT